MIPKDRFCELVVTGPIPNTLSYCVNKAEVEVDGKFYCEDCAEALAINQEK